MNTIDNQSWLLVHKYVVYNWLHIPIFLSIERVVIGLSVDNLIHVLMQSLMNQGGLTKDMIGKRFMTFGVDGVYVFQGARSGVTKHIYDGWAFDSMGVQYGL